MRTRASSAERGSIYVVDLEPTVGNEQRGRRPVLVVSRRPFNEMGVSLICPIATVGNLARSAGFAVQLAGMGLSTTGVVLCNQPRTVDLKALKAKYVERAPQTVVDEVLDVLRTLLD